MHYKKNLIHFFILWAISPVGIVEGIINWKSDDHGILRPSIETQSCLGSVPSRYGTEVQDGHSFPLAVVTFPDTEVGTSESDSLGYFALPKEAKLWLQRLGVIGPEGQFSKKLLVAFTIHQPCDSKVAIWQSNRRGSSHVAVKFLSLAQGEIAFEKQFDEGIEIKAASLPNGFFLRRFCRDLNTATDAATKWWETKIRDMNSAQDFRFAVFIITRKKVIVCVDIIPQEVAGTSRTAQEILLNSCPELSNALERLSSWGGSSSPQVRMSTHHQVLADDPILEGGAKMSTLIPSDTVGINIHSATGPTNVLKCTKHDNHAVNLPTEIGNMLVRMGLATPRANIATTDGYYDLDLKVTFQTTEHQLPQGYIAESPLEFIPHLAICNDRYQGSGAYHQIAFWVWNATLCKNYDICQNAQKSFDFKDRNRGYHDSLNHKSLPGNFVLREISIWRKDATSPKSYIFRPFHSLDFQPKIVNGTYEPFYTTVVSDDGQLYLTQHRVYPANNNWRDDFLAFVEKLKKIDAKKLVSYISERLCDALTKYADKRQIPYASTKPRMAIVTRPSIGEIQWAIRMSIAAEKLGWEWFLIDNLQDSKWIPYLNPHFVISLDEGFAPMPNLINLLVIQSGVQCEENLSRARNTARYDGFLCCCESFDPLKNYVEFAEKKKFYYISTYPTTFKTDFDNRSKTQLFCHGINWDERGDAAYFKVYNLLGDTGYFHVHSKTSGWRNKKRGRWLEKGYEGDIPVDGIGPVAIGTQYGISLLLHGKAFRQTVSMSGKTLEICASSNVIISDKHPWVIREFKNNVYYIDVDNIEDNPDDVFRQIDTHVKHIQNHQEEAIKKAQACHRIFCEKFTLEGEMKKIHDLYEKIMEDRN
ncbi:MAG: hypothetical protein LBB11_00525 [Puniceicoccales bacterium]|jgi:hypothetical protein|nr:hypothetical protein [Puniceicoccales bacterium]